MQKWRWAATAAFLALLLPFNRIQHCCWPDTLGKGKGQGCILLSVSSHTLWTSCAESPPPPSPAVSLPCSPVQLLTVGEVQGGTISTGTLSTAAPVKYKGKWGRDSTLYLQQGEEDRLLMGSLSKSENHYSVIQQSNQMSCQDSLLLLHPEYFSALFQPSLMPWTVPLLFRLRV